MNKSFWQVVGISLFLVSACSPKATPSPVSTTQTATPQATPTLTSTPEPIAECPQEDPNLFPTNILPAGGDVYDEDFINRIINYLNKGGTISALSPEINHANPQAQLYSLSPTDITNDGVPEILIKLYQSYFILKCDHGQYVMVFSIDGSFISPKIDVADLNQDSTPELVISINPCSDNSCPETRILEWNGAKMETLLQVPGDVKRVADVNGDGFEDVLISKPANNSTPQGNDPAITDVYSWNGQEFIPVAPAGGGN